MTHILNNSCQKIRDKFANWTTYPLTTLLWVMGWMAKFVSCNLQVNVSIFLNFGPFLMIFQSGVVCTSKRCCKSEKSAKMAQSWERNKINLLDLHLTNFLVGFPKMKNRYLCNRSITCDIFIFMWLFILLWIFLFAWFFLSLLCFFWFFFLLFVELFWFLNVWFSFSYYFLSYFQKHPNIILIQFQIYFVYKYNNNGCFCFFFYTM